MLKIHFHAAARINSAHDAFGYGRLYHSLVRHVPRVARDVVFVDDYKRADVQACLVTPALNVKYYHWWGRKQHPLQIMISPWEAEVLPEDWYEVLFEHTNTKAIMTNSTWNAQTFQSGLRKWGKSLPVYLLQSGVDVNSFPYLERDWNGELFYLWQGQNLHDRKCDWLVREAFYELDLPDTWLVEKWYPVDTIAWGPHSYTEQRRLEIGQFLSKQGYWDLLGRTHVSLNPTRSEGFGLLPLETACTGMATAVTDWSGCKDYIDPARDCFYPLKYELSKPGEDFFSTSIHNRDFKVEGARDALVDKDDLKAFMVWCYENREAAKAMGRRAHEYVKRTWTWERSALQFVSACRQTWESAHVS